MKLTTGAVARLLGTAESRLQEAVRRERISPPPRVVAGRRLWTADQVHQAAQHLGLLTEALEGEIAAAFAELAEEARP